MNENYIMAVDPGKDGGVCFLDIETNKPELFTIPRFTNKEVDLINLNEIITAFDHDANIIHCILENTHSIFGTGARSNFQFGWINGVLEMAIAANNIPYTKVNPKEWQKVAWQGVEPVKISTGKKTKDGNLKYKTDTKATSLVAANRLFPNESFLPTERSKKPHDGLIDAALMAWYGKVKFS